jgi:hypothetical protein
VRIIPHALEKSAEIASKYPLDKSYKPLLQQS